MTVLLLETIDEDALALLKDSVPVLLSPTPDALAHDLPFEDLQAVITRGLGQVDRALMERCPNLRAVARCGAGLNNLDLEIAAEKNLPVIFAPGINATAVAEQAVMLLLMVLRRGFESAAEVRQGNWACRDDFAGDDLSSKKVCIVGGGSIGQKTATLCRAFSAEVVVCGRGGQGLAGLKAALEEHLPTSDVVSLHIPLTAETNQLFDRDLLALCKPGALLVNTARGELLETGALMEALDSGRLAGYAADVVSGEPPAPDDPVIAHPRSVVTPHVAALTQRTFRELCLYTVRNVLQVLSGGSPDPTSLYQKAVQ